MTQGRGKGNEWGETSKGLLREMEIGHKYGRWPIVSTKYMTKGIEQEEQSLTLFTEHAGRLYVKNQINFKNEWINGTPDIVDGDEVIDIKTSWDIWTFDKAEASDAYYWQLQGYMMLTGATRARLVYCLANASDAQVLREKTSLYYQFGEDASNPEYIAKAMQVEKNMKFDDIPTAARVKIFDVPRLEDMSVISKRVEQAWGLMG